MSITTETGGHPPAASPTRRRKGWRGNSWRIKYTVAFVWAVCSWPASILTYTILLAPPSDPGAESPTAAAIAIPLAAGHAVADDSIVSNVYLCPETRDDIRVRIVAYRTTLARHGDRFGMTLTPSIGQVTMTGPDQAAVTVDVDLTMPAGGQLTRATGTPWTMTVRRNDSGWQVCTVTIPDPCEDFVDCTREPQHQD